LANHAKVSPTLIERIGFTETQDDDDVRNFRHRAGPCLACPHLACKCHQPARSGGLGDRRRCASGPRPHLGSARHSARQPDRSAQSHGQRPRPWQTKRIIAHIEAHLEDTIANDELAALINLSTGHFTRAFRQTFNTTPHAYVLDRRVELAAEMMTGSDEKLAIIAASCGFHDQSHLSRIFRRAKGVTPAVWRRRHAAFAMAQA
jgi:AraC-like DNA-binding protein